MVSTKNSARPEQTKLMICAQCHRPPTAERPLKQCGRCQHAYYCSIDCQRENWKTHERECVKPGQCSPTTDYDAAEHQDDGLTCRCL